jgi:zinc finger protein
LGTLNPFMGDSAQSGFSSKMKTFLTKLDDIQQGKLTNITVILDDPCGNSYLQNIYAPENDPNMEIIEYERSHEQNEYLGLNDIKTENYS